MLLVHCVVSTLKDDLFVSIRAQTENIGRRNMVEQAGGKKALLLVDVQNDFCPGGLLAVTHGDEVVSPLNRMVRFAKNNGWLIVASRDWHPEVTNHFQKYGGLWPVHCVQGTKGAEFHPALNVAGAVIISKATKPDENGYSPFDMTAEDSSGRTLEKVLREAGVTEVYLGGLATDYCVKAAAIDAARLGFKTVLLLDAVRAVNLKSTDEAYALEEMILAGVLISFVTNILGGAP